MKPETVGEMREQCDLWLLSLLGSRSLVERWWAGPNRAFGMQTPENVFLESPDRVRNYLRQF